MKPLHVILLVREILNSIGPPGSLTWYIWGDTIAVYRRSGGPMLVRIPASDFVRQDAHDYVGELVRVASLALALRGAAR